MNYEIVDTNSTEFNDVGRRIEIFKHNLQLAMWFADFDICVIGAGYNIFEEIRR